VLRALCCLLIACSSPPPPVAKPPPPQPVITTTDGPSWIGVRLDNGPPRITQVIRGAPGDRAGLHIGDLILTIDGETVETPAEFVRHVMKTPNGKPVSVVISRGGGPITFKIPVEARPDSPAKSALLDKPAPAFEAAQLSGPYATKLADHKGHVVVVDFWATWCGPCAITIPRLTELHTKFSPMGLRIIGLSNEEPDVIREFVAARQIPYAIGRDADDSISQQYLREGIPMFVIIDKAGIVRHVVVGAAMDEVDRAVTAVLGTP